MKTTYVPKSSTTNFDQSINIIIEQTNLKIKEMMNTKAAAVTRNQILESNMNKFQNEIEFTLNIIEEKKLRYEETVTC